MNSEVSTTASFASHSSVRFAEEGTLSLEVRYWSSAAYMAMLSAAAPAGIDANQWKLAPDPMLGAPVATTAHSTGLASLFECLVQDSIQKQAALEHVQRAADCASQRCEIYSWRVKDLDGRTRVLSGDLEAMRRMLHESKEGTISAAEVEQLSGLNAEQLLARCHAYAARAQMERTRCTELLKRLKVKSSCLHTLVSFSSRGIISSACDFTVVLRWFEGLYKLAHGHQL
jgi:hypothetical protein